MCLDDSGFDQRFKEIDRLSGKKTQRIDFIEVREGGGKVRETNFKLASLVQKTRNIEDNSRALK